MKVYVVCKNCETIEEAVDYGGKTIDYDMNVFRGVFTSSSKALEFINEDIAAIREDYTDLACTWLNNTIERFKGRDEYGIKECICREVVTVSYNFEFGECNDTYCIYEIELE